MNNTRRKTLHVRCQQGRDAEPPHVVESNEIEGHKEQREPVPGDDCEGIVDDSDDKLIKEVEENVVEEEEVGGIQIEEEVCEVLSTQLGDITRNDEGDDDESGDEDC